MSKSDDDNAYCRLGWDWVAFLVICIYIISVLLNGRLSHYIYISNHVA